jgi:hypothetical protein
MAHGVFLASGPSKSHFLLLSLKLLGVSLRFLATDYLG